MLEKLQKFASSVGKTEWRDLLIYVAQMHVRCIRTEPLFPYPWEEIGPGYCYGPGFGDHDLIHQMMDLAEHEPEHVRRQLVNNLHYQLPDGLVPGCLYLRDGKLQYQTRSGHMPVWVIAADACHQKIGDRDFLRMCYNALVKQLGWFHEKRKAIGPGYFYDDILGGSWESGSDEGVHFVGAPQEKLGCVDATSHVYLMCDIGARWADELGENADDLKRERDELRDYLCNVLYDPETGWFYDSWNRDKPDRFAECFESLWPVIVGAATPEQAKATLAHVMNPEEFFCRHAISTVSLASPRFEKRMWRGPAWNSMTYWALFGLVRYGFLQEAAQIAERALDASAKIFAETGTIWEFYDPDGGDPHLVERKPANKDAANYPSPEYLGHNPLIEMARIWEMGAGK